MENLSTLEQFKGFLETPQIFPPNYNRNIKNFIFPELKFTRALKEDLLKLDHPRNSVLGKRMESFFEIAIKHSERYKLIASNLQIIQDKKTIGELDFLVFDTERSKPLHIELVYKLYIYDPLLSPEINRWIGPNRKDSFSEKLEKLEARQFPLLNRPETLDYLNRFGLNPEEIEQQLCFKAQLFLAETMQPDDSAINSACLKGKWYKFEEFKNSGWNENLFYSPKKKDWSCSPENNTIWFGYDELLSQVESLFQRKKAPLVWMKTKTAYKSFFIVWW